MTKQLEGHESSSERWTLLRDLGVFQVKLVADGLRDLILVPTSLIAGIVSLVKGENGKPGPIVPDHPTKHFHDMLTDPDEQK